MRIDNRLLQLELMKMMKVFHEICEKNNLTYYILGGTCLGAIRHKGFIPWDDDMDVGLPRADYEKFFQIVSRESPLNIDLKCYRNTSQTPFHYIKFINNTTTLIESSYKKCVEGIYLDVFPLDGLKKYGIIQKNRFRVIHFLHALIMNHFYTKENRKVVNRFFEFIAKRINPRKVHFILECLMNRENLKEKPAFLCNFLGAWGEREIIPSSVFGAGKLYQFEDAMLYGPENPDAYLRSLYGDYMQLPPEEKRVCKHDYFYINLNKPYKEYKFNEG